MDTSETYIKMRRMAKGDLLMGTPIEIPCNHITNDAWVDSKGNWYYATEDEVFQLERQDQLQEMVGGTLPELIVMFAHFIFGELSSWRNVEQKYPSQFTSMEQLWLAFVMNEKYNKTWNGKEWERL